MTKLWQYYGCSDRYTTISICQYKFYVSKLVNFIYFIIFIIFRNIPVIFQDMYTIIKVIYILSHQTLSIDLCLS